MLARAHGDASSRRLRFAATGSLVFALSALLVVAAEPARAALPQQSGAVDLLTQANLQLDGATPEEFAGFSVNGAGDVNGDGLDDVVVGARKADANGRADSGSAYVVFGRRSQTRLDLAALGIAGFRIDGATAGDLTGHSVAGAGDVNGDGLDDVVVSGHLADRNNRSNSGSAYVVFGRTSTAPVDLASLGSSGFRVDGAGARDEASNSVAGAGDVNGDGRDDVAIGAYLHDGTGRSDAGAAYVIFGRAGTSTVDLAALGSAGFRVDGAAAFNDAGTAVGGAGDVNGDGRDDLLVGAIYDDYAGRMMAGSTYLVFGRTGTSAVDLAAPGGAAVRFGGAADFDRTGWTVDGAGDVNGDGRDDMVIGSAANAAYVVFGSPTPVSLDLAAMGQAGFTIKGGQGWAGQAVSIAGDLNSDGRADVLVGDIAADPYGRSDAGTAFAVYGRNSTADVNLGALGSGGIALGGGSSLDYAGASVAGAGDVNGDGRADALVGASDADVSGRAYGGSAYVVYGFGAPRLSYEPLVADAGDAIAPHSPALERTGPATFSVSPTLPSGLSLNSSTGVITGTPTSPQPATDYRVTMTDLSGSVTTDVSVEIEGSGGDPGSDPGGDPDGDPGGDAPGRGSDVDPAEGSEAPPDKPAQTRLVTGLRLVQRQRIKKARARGLGLQIGCAVDCTLRLELLLDRRSARKLGLPASQRSLVVALRTIRLEATRATKVWLKLRPQARRRLAGARRVRLRLRVRARAPGQEPETVVRTVSFVR